MLLKTGDIHIISAAICLFPRWIKDYMSDVCFTVERKIPWINYKANFFLNSIIHKNMYVFEWGSGGSTIYFSERCKNVVSIEHDKNWYDIVQQKFLINQTQNVAYFYIAPQKDLPITCYSKSKDYAQYDFSFYVNKINDYPDNYFDLIVVDGRARNFCLAQALSKVKVGGYIMVDNSERAYYISDFTQLKDKKIWKSNTLRGPVPFQHAFTQSSFFKRLI